MLGSGGSIQFWFRLRRRRDKDLRVLVIRTSQVQALASPMVARFEAWLLAHARTEHRPETSNLDDDALMARLRGLIARAEGYGIEDEEHLVAYVDVALERGEGFEDAPGFTWAAALLADEGIDPEDRVPILLARLEARR